jgi:hypothetical protein
MARAGEHTPLRRILMQATLCLMLLAAIGLAAAVDWHINRQFHPTLGPEQSDGSLQFRLPASWHVQLGSNDDPLVAAVAVEPSGSMRKLTVYSQTLRQYMAPGDYLRRSGMLDDVFTSGVVRASPCTLGGWPALCVQGQRGAQNAASAPIESEFLVCGVFPNHQAVTLWLSKPGELTPADQSLLDEVVATIKISGLGQPADTIGPP